MSGGSLDYVYSDIRHQVIEKIEHGDVHDGRGVDGEVVEWDVEQTVEYLDDLAAVLRDYEWWQSGDTGEEKYREAEKEFVNKWE